MRNHLSRLLVLWLTIVPASASNLSYEKVMTLIDHPSAVIITDTITCASKEAYKRYMDLLRTDDAAAKTFLIKALKQAVCGPIDGGTKVIVEEPDEFEPMRFHIKGKPTQLWIYVEAVEPKADK